MDFDLKIVGGTIIDGSGREGYRGDVGIRNGRIVALGKADGGAARTIDAGGLIVSPGFVDIHTHYDAQVLWDKMLSISPWHGVTTAVLGNCGFGVAPMRPADRKGIMRTLEKVEGMSYEALEAGLGLDWPFESFPEYLSAITNSGMAINLAAFIGHTPVRLYVMGDDAMEREATTEEVEAMASSGRGIMQCTIGKKLFHDEMSDLARRHKIPVTWTALLSGMTGPGSHRRHLKLTAEQRAEGLDIVPQVACRPINFDFDFGEPFPFELLPMFKELMGLDRDAKKGAYGDAAFRSNFKAETAPGMKSLLASWTRRAIISTLPADRTLEERSLAEVAAERGTDPTDLALDMSIESDFAARFRFPFINYDQNEVRELLTNENTVVALSDAGAHASQLCDACYSTHFLGHWCREEGIVPLEEAVHMLTQRPANVMGLTERGRLAEGLPADIVVFDPATIGATGLTRVYDQPAGQDRLVSQAIGIHAVIVNGTPIREGDTDAIDSGQTLPGELLRGGGAA